jgi:hypothetical protein
MNIISDFWRSLTQHPQLARFWSPPFRKAKCGSEGHFFENEKCENNDPRKKNLKK